MTAAPPAVPVLKSQEWFARRTHRTDDFDLLLLAAQKAAGGTTVSVVLPARNEAGTVREVVRAVAELRGDLVDEIIVIDDRSSDATTAVAGAAGATVHQSGDLLPELGPSAGKGDVLYRSLTVAAGDIVVFLDADIRNPDPRFVSGLLGPLLLDPDVQLVKAFYDRPLQVGDRLQPSGGGRVTELLARPLINLFWPDLAGIVQPLSGEYAARRSLLASLPLFTGYGVELGLLIDTLQQAGSAAIAQVDMGQRVHHNQPLEALSRMAFSIAQVAGRRLGISVQEPLEALLPDTYLRFTRDVDRRVHPYAHRLPVLERPPLQCPIPQRPAIKEEQ
jgi:glucosyl-3-phosphoglycerate synthase